MICIQCPRGCRMRAEVEGGELRVTGHRCPKGVDYARREVSDPRRSLTSTVRTSFADMPRLPVRSSQDIPLKEMFAVMKAVNRVVVNRRLRPGDVVLTSLPGCEAVLVAAEDMTGGRNKDDTAACH